MRMSFQKIIVMGNLGADPEERKTQSGIKMAKFRLAVNKKRKDETRTEWFNCLCFDKTADIALRYLKKGDQTLVEGELWSREVAKDDGTKARYTDLEVRDLRLIGGRGGSTGEKFSGVQPAAGVSDEDDILF